MNKITIYLLIILIILIVLIILNPCNKIDFFSVGGNNCPKLSKKDSSYDQMVKCWSSHNNCNFELHPFRNKCVKEKKVKCENVSDQYDIFTGFHSLDIGKQSELCENIYPNYSNRNIKCYLDKDIKNTCKQSRTVPINIDVNTHTLPDYIYLYKLHNLLDKYSNERHTKVLFNNNTKLNINTWDSNKLNDNSDIIDCYTTDELFLQLTPDIEYLKSKERELDLDNVLDVLYYAKNNKILYDWSEPIKLGNIDYDGSTKNLYNIYNLISSAKKTITITTLGNMSSKDFNIEHIENKNKNYCIDYIFLTIIKNGIKKALQNTNKLSIRLIFGGPPILLNEKSLENTLNYLNEDINIKNNCNFLLVNNNANNDEIINSYDEIIWNHSKIIMIDGTSIRIGGQNMFDNVYLSRDYYNNEGGPIMDSNLLVFTKDTLHIINFCNQLCYQSIHKHLKKQKPKIYKYANKLLYNLVNNDIKVFSDMEINAASKININNTIFLNNPIKFKSMFTFKYSNKYDDLLSIDADEQSRVIAFRELSEKSIYISQQRLIDPTDIILFTRNQFEALSIALNKNQNQIVVRVLLSRTDYDDGYSSKTLLLNLKKNLVNNGCSTKKMKYFKLRYVSYLGNDKMGKSAQHTKMWCIDGKLLSIGSHNFYGSPLQQSSIIIDNKKLIDKYLMNDWYPKIERSIKFANIEYVVYIIRHGEKDKINGPLNSRGKKRAQNLINVFNSDINKLDSDNDLNYNYHIKPELIYAHKYNLDGLPNFESERCLQLATPLAEHLNISINHKYGYSQILKNKGNSQAADNIINNLNTNTRCILVVWEHANIHFLANDLGLDKDLIKNWPNTDFDTIYELYYDNNNILVDFNVSNQNF